MIHRKPLSGNLVPGLPAFHSTFPGAWMRLVKIHAIIIHNSVLQVVLVSFQIVWVGWDWSCMEVTEENGKLVVAWWFHPSWMQINLLVKCHITT